MINKYNGKQKGTIFCIHGNSSSSKVFNKLLNSQEITFSKVSIDLLGHGENQIENSDIDNFSFKSNKQLLIDTLSEIDDDILLIGNSLGGHLAIEIAPKIKNLKGLVIMGTPPVKKPINFEEAFIAVPALNTFFSEYPKQQEITEATSVAIVNKEKHNSFIKDFKASDPKVRKATAIDITQNNLSDEFNIFISLNISKYIISGDKDPSVNRDYLEYVKNECNNICTIINLENCGHYPSLDKPDDFITIVNNIAKEVFNK